MEFEGKAKIHKHWSKEELTVLLAEGDKPFALLAQGDVVWTHNGSSPGNKVKPPNLKVNGWIIHGNGW